MSAGAYLRYLGFWVPFPSVFKVRTGSYVSNKDGTEANDTLTAWITNAAVPDAIRPTLQQRGTELLACNVAVGIVTGVEVWARSNVMELGFEIRKVLTHLNARLKDAAFGDLLGSVKYSLPDRSFQ